jgi:hydrogenase maturation protease
VNPNILIAGLGNVLMSDDAIGPHCIAYLLAKYQFPLEVAVLDLGTPDLDLAFHLSSVDAVIAVAAIRGIEPGRLHLFDRVALRSELRPARLDTHTLALEDAIDLVESMSGMRLDVVLIGLEGDCFEHGTSLSWVAQSRLVVLAEQVIAELADRGVRCPRRTPSLPSNTWWEAAATLRQEN